VNYAPQDIGPATQLVGTVLTVVLIVAGVGLVIGNSFTLPSSITAPEQKVFFPRLRAGLPGLGQGSPDPIRGRRSVDRLRAQIFANDIIGVDTMAISGGKTTPN